MSAERKKQRAESIESNRARRQAEEANAARRRQWLFLGGIAIVLAIVAVVVSLVLRANGSSSDLPSIAAATTTIDPAVPQSGITLGDAAAKVTVTEWGDFQCPYCGNFARDVQPQLIADYVKTGKILFEFKNLAFLGDESVQSAEAGACAADQGKFWTFHDVIFANQAGENKGAFSASRLEQIATMAGLNLDQYRSCMSDGTHKKDVAATTAEGNALPITSTPSFVIGGQAVVFSTYANLTTAIDAALAKAGV